MQMDSPQNNPSTPRLQLVQPVGVPPSGQQFTAKSSDMSSSSTKAKSADVGGFGEPPHNGDMEARLAALESAVKELPTKVDFAELRADMSEGREAVHKLLLKLSKIIAVCA